MFKHRFLFGFMVILVGFSASAINFSKVNVAWQYDPSNDFRVLHRTVNVGDNIHVFIRVSSANIGKWRCEFLIQKNYESADHRTIQPTHVDTLKRNENELFIKNSLLPTAEKLLVLKIFWDEKIYYYDINLSIGSLSFPSIYPVDEDGMPILENFINKPNFLWTGSNAFLAMQYQESFPHADPPMARMKLLAPQINVDTTFIFNDSVFLFKENHFYVVQKDSLSAVGVTVLRVPAYFPKYKKLEELIAPILYLTSEYEKKAILTSTKIKQSFNSFWMNTYATEAQARKAIRKYYNLVEYVNKIFTDFKPGWKTDRGMMYIIFGLPDEVYRTTNTEEWHYDNEKAFEFTVISTFFAARTYSLRRNKDLEEKWHRQVAIMRQGNK